jgi:hypothetical protein
MFTKKHLFIILVLLAVRFAAFGQNNQLILQFEEKIQVTQQHLNSIFPNTTVTIAGTASCFNAYLLVFSNNTLAILNDCDSLKTFIQGGPPYPPKTQTGIQSGGWNSANALPSINVNTSLAPDSLWLAQWGHLINTPDNRPKCPLKVAFLDTGIDPTHLTTNPWFVGKTTAFGVNTPNISSVTIDGHGHGTHVCGITAQLLKQYPGISLLSIKTQKNDGTSALWDVIKGIELSVLQGAKIVNMSLAYFPSCPVSNPMAYEDALKGIMQLAGDKYNTLFVTAAGNQGWNLPLGGTVFPSMFNLPNQINVANNNNLGVLHSSSNYGSPYVHVGSTGVNIYSSDLGGSYSKQTGTSMAAPHVTAIAAIVAALQGQGNCGGPVCGVQSLRNPHYLLIKNSILNGSNGAVPALLSGTMQPYFAKESNKYSTICNCH